jgi:hypothetical protein
MNCLESRGCHRDDDPDPEEEAPAARLRCCAWCCGSGGGCCFSCYGCFSCCASLLYSAASISFAVCRGDIANGRQLVVARFCVAIKAAFCERSIPKNCRGSPPRIKSLQGQESELVGAKESLSRASSSCANEDREQKRGKSNARALLAAEEGYGAIRASAVAPAFQRDNRPHRTASRGM